MPNRRKEGLKHVGAWVQPELADDLMLVAHFNASDRAKMITSILKKAVALELGKFPRALRARVRKRLLEQRNGHLRTKTDKTPA